MYRSVLRKLVPWMFGTDHFNYARRISMHLQDLNDLEKTCPDVHRDFLNGHLFTQKSERRFSQLALYQIHEQLNRGERRRLCDRNN